MRLLFLSLAEAQRRAARKTHFICEIKNHSFTVSFFASCSVGVNGEESKKCENREFHREGWEGLAPKKQFLNRLDSSELTGGSPLYILLVHTL